MSRAPFKETTLGILCLGVISSVIATFLWENRPKSTSLNQVPTGTTTNFEPSREQKPKETSGPEPVQPNSEKTTQTSLEATPSSSTPYIPESPIRGYSFPNISGIYSVRLIGFPDDLDDATVQSLIKTDLGARLEAGKPTSSITFHANVDPNWQSDRCVATNGIAAVIDISSDETVGQVRSSFKQGRGFACFGSDRKITEVEALGHAFANMK